MKKLIFSTLLLLFVTFTGMNISANPLPFENGAVLSFEESNFDFGKVKQGEELQHIFKFTNSGTGLLIIQSVQASCGCTGAAIGDKKEFAPGEKGEIKVTFNTTGREGSVNKTVIIVSNDSKEPSKILSFNCEILN